jgi:hypothetical protein
MSIFKILTNKELSNKISNYIDICHDEIIKTRNQIVRKTASCRMWQFKYILLHKFDELNNNIISKNLNKILEDPTIFLKICRIMTQFISTENQHNILYQTIVYNRNLNIIPINNILDLDNNTNIYQHYCMCIYNTDLDIGSILHFFTIIRYKDKYYLNSSYGSDYVCVPQYTLRLNKTEFNKFCINLPNKKEEFKTFFSKYFLKDNLKKRYDNNTIENINPKLKSEWIEPQNGIEKELDIYTYESNYKVGLIPTYEEILEEFINNL